MLTWNHVLTCASVIFNPLANCALSADARYFCLWKRFSNSATWTLVKDVLGFFRFGGVLFWYGCPILRVIGNPVKKYLSSSLCKWFAKKEWYRDDINMTTPLRCQGMADFFNNVKKLSFKVFLNRFYRKCSLFESLRFINGFPRFLWSSTFVK